MKKWTKEEVALLLEYSKQLTPLEQRLSEFPGRTAQSLYHRLRRMNKSKVRIKGRRPFRSDDVFRLLSENGPMFAKDIAAGLGLQVGGIRELLADMHRDKKVHIKERILAGGRNRTFLWAAGEGADAPQAGATKRAAPIRKVCAEMPRQPTQVTIRRDPFISALFGERAAA